MFFLKDKLLKKLVIMLVKNEDESFYYIYLDFFGFCLDY